MHARAASGDGDNAELDRNQQPSGKADGGVEPNGDDYVIHVACHARAPYLFYNPVFNQFDPGGFLRTAWSGMLTNVDLGALVGGPLVVPFTSTTWRATFCEARITSS